MRESTTWPFPWGSRRPPRRKSSEAPGGGHTTAGPGPRKGDYRAIRDAYQGDYQILISNLDTLANRLVHPEACRGLARWLDLIVLDEVHLLTGLYGAHARMLLRRLLLLRQLWRL